MTHPMDGWIRDHYAADDVGEHHSASGRARDVSVSDAAERIVLGRARAGPGPAIHRLSERLGAGQHPHRASLSRAGRARPRDPRRGLDYAVRAHPARQAAEHHRRQSGPAGRDAPAACSLRWRPTRRSLRAMGARAERRHRLLAMAGRQVGDRWALAANGRGHHVVVRLRAISRSDPIGAQTTRRCSIRPTAR